ncbi:MAG: hypothetical protein NDJ90_10080 [Oligoflexia bacterium]|nr:hypothetical protein [Oligoflexia bacterium]
MKVSTPFLSAALLLLLAIPLSWAGPSGPSGTYQASAKRQPWSGYWWSMERGELVLGWDDGAGRREWSAEAVLDFDACVASYSRECTALIAKMAGRDGAALSPLMKFDFAMRKLNEKLYGPGGAPASSATHAARWELDHHFIGEDTSHRYYDSRGFAGKCIGWALSTIDFDEPTEARVLEGVLFKPADIKGLLAAIYNGAQFFVPSENFVGNAYYEQGGTARDYEDVLPHELLRALALTIDRGQILEADLDPGTGVWNYPVYRYEMKWKVAKPGAVAGELTLHYADDEVGIDEVFTPNPARPDLKKRKLTFELKVPAGWNGDFALVTESRWTGKSVDEHPDALILGLEKDWRNKIYRYKNTKMNQEVNFPLLKRINPDGRGWVPFVDLLLRNYYGRPARN